MFEVEIEHGIEFSGGNVSSVTCLFGYMLGARFNLSSRITSVIVMSS
jgi:hypothetical protein